MHYLLFPFKTLDLTLTRQDTVSGMQAFLLIGTNKEELKAKIDELAKKLKAKILAFPIAKIEDTRNLNDLIRLSFSEPTLVVCENIDNATEEALNAFLKNLEEPQENIYFALTAASSRKVLPTIVSRCQIIKIQNTSYQIPNTGIEEFLSMTASQKLTFFAKIRTRDEAIDFIESLIFFLHGLHDLTNMELLLTTLTRLKANGNISLQLTNLVVKMSG